MKKLSSVLLWLGLIIVFFIVREAKYYDNDLMKYLSDYWIGIYLVFLCFLFSWTTRQKDKNYE
jgi:hypothetical protein